MKYRVSQFAACILFLILIFFISFLFIQKKNLEKKDSPLPILTTPTPSLVKVLYVIDGDTIVIEGGERVRYIGIDAPEIKYQQKNVECFGEEAWIKNRELVEEKYVYLEKDVSEKDIYGRLLRYVWVGNPYSSSQEAFFVNDYLVREGYVFARTFAPDVKYARQFQEAERYARNQKRGLWKECIVIQ